MVTSAGTAAIKTLTASVTTSGPMPSPGMSASLTDLFSSAVLGMPVLLGRLTGSPFSVPVGMRGFRGGVQYGALRSIGRGSQHGRNSHHGYRHRHFPVRRRRDPD